MTTPTIEPDVVEREGRFERSADATERLGALSDAPGAPMGRASSPHGLAGARAL